MAPGNGSPVTWRELELALAPITKSLGELDGKVDSLLDTRAEERGREATNKDVGSRRLAWVALAIAALSGLWWVPAAIGH